MKAIRIHQYGNSSELKLEDIERPKPGPGEVLVRVLRAGVNPVDWKIREGLMKTRADIPKRFPLTMGQDFAGTVVELGGDGEEFESLAVGDRIFGFAQGAYAEYALIKAGDVARIPDELSDEVAAALPTAALTALELVNREVKPERGQTILIHGAAGGVGAVAVQLVALKGARVIAVASQEDETYLSGLGAAQVIDHKTQDFTELASGVDAVIDLVGGTTLERSYGVLKPGGILLSTAGPVNEARAKAAGLRVSQFVMSRSSDGLSELAELVANGQLKVQVSQVLPLDKAREAQDALQEGKKRGHVNGKLVLRLN